MTSDFAIAFARSQSAESWPDADREAGRLARRKALALANAFDAPVSVSHTDGLGAAIASLNAVCVGIDLVRAGSVTHHEHRFFLTSSELQQRPPLTLSHRWALKEAAWKALRCERSMPLKSIELVHGPSGSLTGVRKLGVLHAARSLILRPWPGYIAAVVVLENE